jgi:hypothetical protein
MLLRPISLVLLSISGLHTPAPGPASRAPFAGTQAKSFQARSDADEVVDWLVQNATALHAILPSITAHEVVHTDTSHGTLSKHSQAEGTVRVLRAANGSPLKETHQMTGRNGKPLASDDPKGAPQLADAFTGAQDLFFSRRNRPCFTFTLAPRPTKDDPLELYIGVSPEYASSPGCPPGLQGLAGVALVDPATHQLTHLARAIPTEGDSPARVVSTDYSPASVGDKTYWLPELTLSSDVQGKTKVFTAVYYSDYHQYAATVTVLAAASQ